MSAPLILLTLDVATVVCAALIGALVLSRFPRLWSAQLIALIAVDTVCSIVLGRQDYGYWIEPAFRVDVGGWATALNLARNLTAGLLMLLCHSLFARSGRFPRWLLVLLATQLLLEGAAPALVPAGWRPLANQTAPALLQTLFVGFALYWTVADWRGDLVESRRRTRALMFVVIGLVTIASVLLTRVVIDPDSQASYAVHVALTASYLPIQLFVLFQLMRGDFGRFIAGGRQAAASRAPSPAIDATLQSALSRLTALLEVEQICEQPGLSLGSLAARVGLPEYRLRKLIHEQLGYQNFNALLHDYRVKAACTRLSDPGMRRTPILTIALSVGYSSVNTFNRGFREVMNVTPSAYRSLSLSGGAPNTAPAGE